MKVEQENIRLKFITFINKSGIKQSFVSEQIKIPTDVLSKFKNGKKELWTDDLERLNQFLTNRI